MGLSACSKPDSRPFTAALGDLPGGDFDEGSAADAAGDAVHRGPPGGTLALVASPPSSRDLRSVQLSVSSLSAKFIAMVGAGEVQTSRAVALM